MNDTIVNYFNYLFGGGILAILAFSLNSYLKINKVKDEMDQKINRTYLRLDEVKDKNDLTYTKKDVCEIIHKRVDERLEKIEKLTEDIPKIKVGVDMLLNRNNLGDR